MARTKADAGKKAGGKAPRKAPVLRNTPSSSGGVSKRKSRSSAGARNAVCKRPVPKWQLSVKDLDWMKPGSSKDEEPVVLDVIDLASDGSSATTCGSTASNSLNGDDVTNSENGESIDEGNDVENDIEGEDGEVLHQDTDDSDEYMHEDNEEVNPVEDIKDGGVELADNHNEDTSLDEGAIIDSDEYMHQDKEEVNPVEDIKDGGVELADNHHNEDTSLDEEAIIDDTEDKMLEEISKEFNKNEEEEKITVEDDLKEAEPTEAEIVAAEEDEGIAGEIED